MARVRVLVLSGYGLNCEEEAAYAFELAGANAEIVHVNDLIDGGKKLDRYQILVIPGGFSYGDDTGSGRAYANKLKNQLGEELEEFVSKDKLVIGICNGFQILTHLGLLPGTLLHNRTARYVDRWVDLTVKNGSPWLEGIRTISLPIAHGEGSYYAPKKTLAELKRGDQVALGYVEGEICDYQDLVANPNGALEDIAGITDESGRVLGLMPHPERAVFFTQLPHWTWVKESCRRKGKKLPTVGPGLQIFQNGVRYFS